MNKKQFKVDLFMTAKSIGSGDLNVLGTPAAIGLAENVSMLIGRTIIDDTQTTVGSYIDIHHIKPTKLGQTVVVEATLTEKNGAVCEFDFTIMEKETVVAFGTHKRVIVNRETFLTNLKE